MLDVTLTVFLYLAYQFSENIGRVLRIESYVVKSAMKKQIEALRTQRRELSVWIGSTYLLRSDRLSQHCQEAGRERIQRGATATRAVAAELSEPLHPQADTYDGAQ